jgi:hypothetical protein
MRWPARRFERCYKLHQKRRIVSGLERQKSEMVAALWSNSNWDDDKGSRKKAIGDIEENYHEAIEAIELALRPQSIILEEETMTDDNPVFAAAERGLQKIQTEYGPKVKKKPDTIDYMKGLDQE